MDGQEVQVIVVTSKNRSNIILSEVRSCWSQEMISKLHSVIEDVFIESHSNRSHFSDGFTRSKHHVSPSVHCFGPFWEVFRNNLVVFRFSVSRAFSNVPKESPFCIESGRTLRERSVLFIIVGKPFTVISSFLHIFRGRSDLVMLLRMNLWNLLSIIEIVSSFSKVFLNHLTVFFVILLVNVRVFHDDNTIIV